MIPDLDCGKWVDHATIVPDGVTEDALHPPVLSCWAETSITVPDVETTPVKGLLSRFCLSDSVSKPSWETRQPQHSLIC